MPVNALAEGPIHLKNLEILELMKYSFLNSPEPLGRANCAQTRFPRGTFRAVTGKFPEIRQSRQ
jgi:hypothetical protein